MLFNIVEEMKIAAQLPAMPKVYYIPTHRRMPLRPDATRQGGGCSHRRLARQAQPRELQGVIATKSAYRAPGYPVCHTGRYHLGTIVLLTDVFLRALYMVPSAILQRDNNNAQGIMIIIALLPRFWRR
jgi:hypothetical protein